MGVIHKDVVQYTWTTRDHLIAQLWPKKLVEGSKNEDRYVTPYRIFPSSLPDCKKWKAGDSVPIALDRSSERWAVNLFFVDGCEWVEIPKEVSGYKTIAELCAKLYAHNPNRFLAAYYDFSKKTPKAKSDVAQMLFNYWKNSAYRHATIQAGFNYADPRYLEIPTEVSGQKLRWVLAKKPVPVKVAVAPGQQSVQVEDPHLDALSADISQMERKANRIMELLRVSETIMRGRLTLAQRFTALHTFIDVCANAHPEDNPDAIFLAKASRELDKKVLDSLRNKPIKEMLEETEVPPSLMVALRKTFGYSDDIAAEIRALGLELVEKLTADKDFSSRCAEWARLVVKKGWVGTPAFQVRHEKLLQAFVSVMGALQEVHTPEAFSETLLKILQKVPDEPITDDNAIVKLGHGPALEVVLATTGAGSTLFMSVVGNSPGPPSLYIATVQLRASKEIARAMVGANPSATCLKLRDEILAQLRRSLTDDQKLADQLEKAVRSNNQEAMLRIRTKVLDQIGGPIQSSQWWKGGILLLQILAFAMAIAAVEGKDTVKIADILGIVGSGVMMIVSVPDFILGFAKVQISSNLTKLGMGLGAVSSFIGVMLAVMQFAEADKNHDHLGMFVSATSILGNFCLLIGTIGWYGASIPGLNVAGLILVATGSLVTLAAVAIDEATPITRKVARSLISSIKSHPMYELLAADPEIVQLVKTVERKLEEVFLPQPQHNTFVVDRLLGAGFNKLEIGVFADPVGAPLMP